MKLTKSDLFKIYSWFDQLRGNKAVLEDEDYRVTKKIRKELVEGK